MTCGSRSYGQTGHAPLSSCTDPRRLSARRSFVASGSNPAMEKTLEGLDDQTRPDKGDAE
jgi:hypothetical protein